MAPPQFDTQSCQVPASAYFNLSASTAVGLFVAGAVPYKVFVPGAAAIAAMGWTGLPYRVLVYWGTGTSAFTDGGTKTTPATNVGAVWTDNAVNIGRKLGYGAANDGSAAVPSTTWPTLVVGLQLTLGWNGSGNLAGASFIMHDAILADVFSKYNCDQNFIYGCGASTGSTNLSMYCLGQSWWPTRYPIKYAAITTVAGGMSGSGTRQTWPEAIPGEDSTNQTFPRIGARIVKMKLPWWDVHSVNDSQSTPVQYGFVEDNVKRNWPDIGNPIPAGQSAGTLHFHGKYYRFQEFTGGSAPDHASPTCIFDYFYGNNAVGSPLAAPGGPLVPTDPWATWMFQQKLYNPPKASTFIRQSTDSPPPPIVGLVPQSRNWP